ncbi:hypothetical protein pb186bvf_004366 [Paramecium bursaria]
MRAINKKVGIWTIDQTKRLGKGAYGEVFLANDGKQTVAAKVINTQNAKEKKFITQKAQEEIEIMRRITHENVVRLLDVQVTQNNIYIFMEYCKSGTLEQYIFRKNMNNPIKYLAESEALIIMKQIVNGYKALYDQRIVHRDLKPQNILMHQGIVKITDFGFSKIVTDQQDQQSVLLTTCAGSPYYMSLQLLQAEQYTVKADIWSLGILFFEILFGKLPWVAVSIVDLIQKIKNVQLSFPNYPRVSQETKDLLSQMIHNEEQPRLSFEQLFSHRYFNLLQDKQNQDEMKKSVILIQSIKDDFQKSNQFKNTYFKEQKCVQNIEQAYQIQNQIQKTAPELMADNDFKVDLNLDVNNFNNQIQEDNKQQQIIDKINQWITHKKNKSIFLNNISQLWYDVNERNPFVSRLDYLSFLFLFTKYQTTILFRIMCRLQSRKIEETKHFKQEDWTLFCKSSEYKISFQAIQSDFTVIKKFFYYLIPLTQNILDGNDKQPIHNEIQQICNKEQVDKKKFSALFQRFCQRILGFKKNLEDDMNYKHLFIYLNDLTQMNQVFKFMGPNQIDFFVYYEQVQYKLNN